MAPRRNYNEPKNAFVADFIGESNIIDGIMIEDRLVEFLAAVSNALTAALKGEPADAYARRIWTVQ